MCFWHKSHTAVPLERSKMFSPRWNVAGVLYAVVDTTQADLLVEKKETLIYKHWMNPLIQKGSFLSCKLARGCARTGATSEQRGAESGGIPVGLSPLCPKSWAFLLILDYFCFLTGCVERAGLCFLPMSPAHLDSAPLTVSHSWHARHR